MSELLGDAPDDERETTLNALGVSAGIRLPGNPLDSLAPGGVAASLAMAWPRFASALAARIPTVVVLEDLHWASSELLDMIEHIVRRAVGPLVVLATARPEVLVARPDIGANEHLTMIGLGPLGEAESRRLVAQLLGPGKLDIPTRDGLLARAEGNPFYLEQLALHVRSSRGGLLPDTLQSLLASRMDTLSIADRRVLQEAAVIGRIFWVEPLVRALDDDRVAARLAALERSGFVVRRPSSSLPGQVEHAFRHALLHDVAYASMPRARRARAHAAAGAWLEAIVQRRATVTASPDFGYRNCLRHIPSSEPFDLSSLRVAFTGAEPIRISTVREFEARFGLRDVVCPCYGLAEATLAVTMMPPGSPLRLDESGRHISVGRPLPGTEVRIAGASAPGDAGEILIRSPGVMQGYSRKPEETKEVLRDGWLHSGDLGFLDAEGYLYVTGRRKNVIIVGGRNLMPRDFEEVVDQFPEVRYSAAVGEDSERLGTERLVVVAEVRDEAMRESEASRLVRAIVARIHEHRGLRPGRVLLVRKGAIPKTTSGKIQHARLAEIVTSPDFAAQIVYPRRHGDAP